MKTNKEKIILKSGFTLLELLIVVLIIGILAAIALPQYKLAVLRSHYAKAKEYVESMYGSVQRFYLINGAWPTQINELDVSLPGKIMWGNHIDISTGMTCFIWYTTTGTSGTVGCQFKKFGKTMRYDHHFQEDNNRTCYAGGSDTNTLHAKLCQIETGKTSSDVWYTY